MSLLKNYNRIKEDIENKFNIRFIKKYFYMVVSLSDISLKEHNHIGLKIYLIQMVKNIKSVIYPLFSNLPKNYPGRKHTINLIIFVL